MTKSTPKVSDLYTTCDPDGVHHLISVIGVDKNKVKFFRLKGLSFSCNSYMAVWLIRKYWRKL